MSGIATSVRLSEATAQKLELLSARTGRSKSFYLRNAIEESIDRMIYEYSILADLEDIRRGRLETMTSEEVKDYLGLDD